MINYPPCLKASVVAVSDEEVNGKNVSVYNIKIVKDAEGSTAPISWNVVRSLDDFLENHSTIKNNYGLLKKFQFTHKKVLNLLRGRNNVHQMDECVRQYLDELISLNPIPDEVVSFLALENSKYSRRKSKSSKSFSSYNFDDINAEPHSYAEARRLSIGSGTTSPFASPSAANNSHYFPEEDLKSHENLNISFAEKRDDSSIHMHTLSSAKSFDDLAVMGEQVEYIVESPKRNNEQNSKHIVSFEATPTLTSTTAAPLKSSEQNTTAQHNDCTNSNSNGNSNGNTATPSQTIDNKQNNNSSSIFKLPLMSNRKSKDTSETNKNKSNTVNSVTAPEVPVDRITRECNTAMFCILLSLLVFSVAVLGSLVVGAVEMMLYPKQIYGTVTTAAHSYFSEVEAFIQFVFQVSMLLLYISYLHRVIGHFVGVLLRQILGTAGPKGVGKFNIHFKYISFRLGLDKNEIIIGNITWYNTETFKKTPYFLNIGEIVVSVNVYSIYLNIMGASKAVQNTTNNNANNSTNNTNSTTQYEKPPIEINEVIINHIRLFIEKSSNKKEEGLNLFAALGAENNKQEKSLQATITANMAAVLDSTSATSQEIANLVLKYNPASLLLKGGSIAVSGGTSLVSNTVTAGSSLVSNTASVGSSVVLGTVNVGSEIVGNAASAGYSAVSTTASFGTGLVTSAAGGVVGLFGGKKQKNKRDNNTAVTATANTTGTVDSSGYEIPDIVHVTNIPPTISEEDDGEEAAEWRSVSSLQDTADHRESFELNISTANNTITNGDGGIATAIKNADCSDSDDDAAAQLAYKNRTIENINVSIDNKNIKDSKQSNEKISGFGVPYKILVHKLLIYDIQLFAQDFLNATSSHSAGNDSNSSRGTAIELLLLSMVASELGKRNKKFKKGKTSTESEYKGVFLDDIVWKLVNKIIAELLRTNKMAMLTIFASAAANQTTTAVTNSVNSVLKVGDKGLEKSGRVLGSVLRATGIDNTNTPDKKYEKREE